MDESNFPEEIRNWEHPPWYGNTQFKEKVTLIFLENQKGLFHHVTTRFRMPVKRWMIFGPCQETSYTAITLNQESNFTRREKNHSFFHWNTLTSPELHIRIWMLSKNEETPPDGYMWSGERLTRNQLTSRPDHLWPELWIKMWRNVQLKERQKWSHEKPKLDNARKLRGIYFIDPEDKEVKETIKNARKKLQTPMALAMPCTTSKTCKHGVTRGKSNEIKSKLACILEASESTRLRMEESLPNYHEDHIAGKGDKSLQHCNLVHKFIPMPQAMKIPAAKAAVEK